MSVIKKFFVLLGNYLPPKINIFFYKLGGVNLGKVWIGNMCYLDTKYPNNITIEDEVCLSFGVKLITHFDPEESIKFHKIKKYNKKILIKKGTFIGPGTIILPGVTIEKNCFVRAGSVVSKSLVENSIVEGNPAKIIGIMNTRTSKIINHINKKNII